MLPKLVQSSLLFSFTRVNISPDWPPSEQTIHHLHLGDVFDRSAPLRMGHVLGDPWEQRQAGAAPFGTSTAHTQEFEGQGL
jgi:hypothetical protein